MRQMKDRDSNSSLTRFEQSVGGHVPVGNYEDVDDDARLPLRSVFSYFFRLLRLASGRTSLARIAILPRYWLTRCRCLTVAAPARGGVTRRPATTTRARLTGVQEHLHRSRLRPVLPGLPQGHRPQDRLPQGRLPQDRLPVTLATLTTIYRSEHIPTNDRV